MTDEEEKEIIKIQLQTDIVELKKDADAGMSQEDLDRTVDWIWKKAWKFDLEDMVFAEIFGK